MSVFFFSCHPDSPTVQSLRGEMCIPTVEAVNIDSDAGHSCCSFVLLVFLRYNRLLICLSEVQSRGRREGVREGVSEEVSPLSAMCRPGIVSSLIFPPSRLVVVGSFRVGAVTLLLAM